MSVIHETLKSADSAKAERASVVRPVRAAAAGWFPWLALSLVTAAGTFAYFSERGSRLRSEEKMRQAYLELNDARGDGQNLILKREETEDRLAKARKELLSLNAAKQRIEIENFEKEKRISDLTRQNHELGMNVLQLREELAVLKAERESHASAFDSAEKAPQA